MVCFCNACLLCLVAVSCSLVNKTGIYTLSWEKTGWECSGWLFFGSGMFRDGFYGFFLVIPVRKLFILMVVINAMYDLVIIGAGSAGYHAAMSAVKLKKKVCVIDKGPFGGLCILKGCMPSKTLLYSARLMELFKKAHKFGVYAEGRVAIDMPHMISRKNGIIKGFADYRKESFDKKVKSREIDFIPGEAGFVDRNSVRVGEKLVKGVNFLIATGSEVVIPEINGLKETGYITSDDALELKKLPGSI